MIDEVKNKKIYIILTYSGTMLSRLIKVYTHEKYCHVSVALDESLSEMYSFGRLKPYNPFNAGFVHEQLYSGTFKRFKNTKTEVYSVNVTDSQYNKVKQIINEFNLNCNKYKFNIVGLFAVAFNIKYKKRNSFYCAEFVKYIVENANLQMELPELVKPMDFKNQDIMNLEYKGRLRNYKIIE